MKLLGCALAFGALALPAAQASQRASVPGVVYTPGYGNSIVTSYDPVTLARSGPRIRLGGNASSWAWSPRRRYLAVASYPQRLTVIDVGAARVVGRIRLSAGGRAVRAVTWTRPDRVVAVVETPRGVVVSAVDPAGGRVIRRTEIARPFTFEFDRVPGGLVFLLGAHRRIEPARLVVVDAAGRVRMAAVPHVLAGRSPSGRHAAPGLAVDPNAGVAYVVGGDRIVSVDLRTLASSGRGRLRTSAKLVSGSSRSAEWLGNGHLAVSGTDWDAERGDTSAGLRIVDVRSWRARVVDADARSFSVAAGRMILERPVGRRALAVTAYRVDGRRLYGTELPWATWMKKQGGFGYACRDAFLRSVIDLGTGRTVHDSFPDGTRCPTLLVADSRG